MTRIRTVAVALAMVVAAAVALGLLGAAPTAAPASVWGVGATVPGEPWLWMPTEYRLGPARTEPNLEDLGWTERLLENNDLLRLGRSTTRLDDLRRLLRLRSRSYGDYHLSDGLVEDGDLTWRRYDLDEY